MAFKFQTKFGSGWFAVEADTLPDFEQSLSDLYGQEKADAVIAGIAGADPTAVPERAASTRSAAPASGGGSAPASRPSSGGIDPNWESNAPDCQHGTRRSRKWQRGGKDQYTYFCPLGQDRKSEQCQPIDAETGKEWGAR